MSSTSFITLYNSCHGEKAYFHSRYKSVKLGEDKTRKGQWENKGGRKIRKLNMTQKMYYKTWKFWLMYTMKTFDSVMMSVSQQLTPKPQVLLSYSFTVHTTYNYGYCFCN